jgi:hypothetical protein
VAARKKAGDTSQKFPIFDRTSSLSAIKLRGHADNPDQVLNRVARWANANDDAVVKKAVAKAREVEKGK